MKTSPSAIFGVCACLFVVASTGCASRKPADTIVEKNMSRIVTLEDGTTCIEPAGLADARETGAAVQLKALIESDEKADEVLAKAKEIKLARDDVEAVWFDACRAYSNAEIKKGELEKFRAAYTGLRQKFLAEGVKEWRDKKDGIADAGKLCLVALPDTDPDHRSFTRVIPEAATVDDCARLAIENGGTEILLGCTKGNWQNTWAKRPISVASVARSHKSLTAKGTPQAPDPDCGWN